MIETIEHNNRFYGEELKTENEQLKEWLIVANKEIERLKEENNFLKLNNPQMNLEHFRVVKENKRKIDNLRLVNKRLNNIIEELKER